VLSNYSAYTPNTASLLNDKSTVKIPAGATFTADQYFDVANSLVNTIPSSTQRSNMFYIYHDLEKLQSSKQSVYAGQQLSGSSSSLIRFDIHTALPGVVHNINLFCVVDVLVQIDMATGLISIKK
jgi:hypothetical protein